MSPYINKVRWRSKESIRLKEVSAMYALMFMLLLDKRMQKEDRAKVRRRHGGHGVTSVPPKVHTGARVKKHLK